MNHYERIGAMLQLLATGPKPLAELRAAIGSKHNTDVYRTRERAEQAGFVTTQAGGIVTLSGGPTFDALMSYQEPPMTIIDHMAAFEARKPEYTDEDGYCALDWYQDGAATHPDFSETLTRALVRDDLVEFIMNDGTIIAWNDQREEWVDEGRIDQGTIERMFTFYSGDLDEVADSLNDVGDLIRALRAEGLRDTAHDIVIIMGGVMEDLGAECDPTEEGAPSDTEGVWAWNDTHMLIGEDWRFELVKRG